MTGDQARGFMYNEIKQARANTCAHARMHARTHELANAFIHNQNFADILYIADTRNNLVRFIKLDDGIVRTMAGAVTRKVRRAIHACMHARAHGCLYMDGWRGRVGRGVARRVHS